MSLEDLDQILPKLVDNGIPGGAHEEFLFHDLDDKQRATQLIALLVWHGYLPMGGMGMLLAKIHLNRTGLKPGDVHIGRKTRRRAKGFVLTVDTAWDEVVRGIQEHTWTNTKGDCWLTSDLASLYKAVNNLPADQRRGVAFHSVELRHAASGRVVAGEIGYTCGSCYSSATGFCLKEEFPGVGAVQLSALGRLLHCSGFRFWDLGMELGYKLELGCKTVARKEWAANIRQLRDISCKLESPVGAGGDAHHLLCDERSGDRCSSDKACEGGRPMGEVTAGVSSTQFSNQRRVSAAVAA